MLRKNQNFYIEKEQQPIIIGGVGGSGTRVVAKILKEIGVWMGGFLNKALDNLWFSIIFKRPYWYLKSSDREKIKNVVLFEKLMIKKNNLTKTEKTKVLVLLIKKINTLPHEKMFSSKILWPIKRLVQNKNKQANKNENKYIKWGWKEPNTHIYLPYLKSYFKNIKYIHVIRNGLDMAFSSNKSQFKTWAKIYGLDMPKNEIEKRKAQLQYWINANKRVKNICKRRLDEDEFVWINFEKLCKKPKEQILKLKKFTGVNKKVNIKKLSKIPKIPDSSGRFRNFNLDIFNDQQIEEVRDLGYII
ncbi:MAG: sulfotransferase [Elusimicrobiota bacterium]